MWRERVNVANIVGLHTPTQTNFPNFALAKVAAYHGSIGDVVAQYDRSIHDEFDLIYSSSVFSWDSRELVPAGAICGGSGYNIKLELPPEMEGMEPDYGTYPEFPHAFGFLTRGCIRNCDFCIVREKEGLLRPYRSAEMVLQGRKTAVFMDNNVLASPHGLSQLEWIADNRVKVDFNQGLDARLVKDDTAILLSKVKWLSPIRLACDSDAEVDAVVKAIELLRWHNATPRAYCVYILVRDEESTLRRLRVFKGMGVTPFVQPYRDKDGTEPPRLLRRLARWVNAGGGKAFKTCSWDEYQKEQGERI